MLLPHIISLTASPNPHNVLSTSVAFVAGRADSARVLFVGKGLAPAGRIRWYRQFAGGAPPRQLGNHELLITGNGAEERLHYFT